MKITTVGLDLAKNVFTLQGVDERGNTVLRKIVRRGKLLELFAQLPACVVGMEACSGTQHWARELRKLGHDPRIMAAESSRIGRAARTTTTMQQRSVRRWGDRRCASCR